MGYLVTNQRVVVRTDVHPASPIVRELPVNTTIAVIYTCRERGHIVSPVTGWCWLSSPNGGSLIRAMNKVVASQLVMTTTKTTTDGSSLIRAMNKVAPQPVITTAKPTSIAAQLLTPITAVETVTRN